MVVKTTKPISEKLAAPEGIQRLVVDLELSSELMRNLHMCLPFHTIRMPGWRS
jgi:hypothetical protein